ncbi:TPA: hypothetical protein Q4A38_14420 [Synechococcus sp. WH 5701]|uniref:hypothetical protein n=1 Tax=Synechococcus sp. WH 5701 TaxID=69042 RepID=UPI003C53CD87
MGQAAAFQGNALNLLLLLFLAPLGVFQLIMIMFYSEACLINELGLGLRLLLWC